LSGQGLNPLTVRMVHGILSTALQKAARDRLIGSNPASGAELPKLRRREMQALDPRQVGRLLAASEATENRWHALWTLLVTTGLRPSEALALRWSDVGEDRVQVRGTLVREGPGWSVTEAKTERSHRVVRVPPMAMAALREHKRRQNKEHLRAGAKYHAQDFVFAGQMGEPIDLRNAARHFKLVLRAYYPLPDIRVYDLRHTFATNTLAAGVSPLTVAKMMGHTSVVMVLEVYGHVLDGQEEEASAKLAARFAATKEA
jgi:integrase